MDKRTIVAKLCKIADELDNQGLYEEADTLTRVAQYFNPLEALSGGAKAVGEWAGKRAKDLNRAYDAAASGIAKGVGELRELPGEMAAKGSDLMAGMSGNDKVEILRLLNEAEQFARGSNWENAKTRAMKADDRLDSMLRMMEQRGVTSGRAYQELMSLKQRAMAVMNDAKQRPFDPRMMADRAQAGQMKTPQVDVNAWTANRLRSAGGSMTKGQLYDLAIKEHGVAFANDVIATIESKPHGAVSIDRGGAQGKASVVRLNK